MGLREYILISILLALLALRVGAGVDPQDGSEADFRAAASQAAESLVLVEARTGTVFGGRTWRNTGFLLGGDAEGGYVATSLLAVTGAPTIRVHTPDGRSAEAEVWAFDQASGLAVLRTGLRSGMGLPSRPEAPEPGEWVVAATAHPTDTGGVIVALHPGLLSSTQGEVRLCGWRWDGLLVAGLTVPTGGAAAPVLDREGKLVGVLVGSHEAEGTGGCCYALPVAKFQNIVSRLRERDGRRLGWLGVAVSREHGREGLRVRGVLGGSPAYAAGIRPGDTLLAVDGEPIGDEGLFESRIGHAEAGTEVELQVLRGEELKSLRVKLGARPFLIARAPLARADTGERREAAVRDAMQRELIRDLRRDNQELRKRVRKLEQRVRALEQEGRTPAGPEL